MGYPKKEEHKYKDFCISAKRYVNYNPREILASIMSLFLLLAASPYGRNVLLLIKFSQK